MIEKLKEAVQTAKRQEAEAEALLAYRHEFGIDTPVADLEDAFEKSVDTRLEIEARLEYEYFKTRKDGQ